MKTQKHTLLATVALRARFYVALLVICIFGWQIAPSRVYAVSTWNPTLLVNTESFQQIDRGDGTSTVDLQFGATTSTLKLLTNSTFQFNKSLSVLGGISGSYLTIDRQANISGALLVKSSITSKSTVSGANLTFMGVTQSYILGDLGIGTSTPTAKIDVRGRANFGSGNLASIPGQLVIQDTAAIGNSLAITTNYNTPSSILGINFVDRISATQQGAEGQVGAFIRSVRDTTSARFDLQFGTASGALSADARAKMTILSSGKVGIGTTAPASSLTVSGATFINGVGTLGATGADGNVALEVVGTISGSRLSITNNASVSGSLVVKNALSGASLFSFGLGDCNNSTTSKLIYNPSTGKFSCATDQTSAGSSGNWSNTGSLRAAFDTRYVKKSGDTMTGALTIVTATTQTATGAFNILQQTHATGAYLKSSTEKEPALAIDIVGTPNAPHLIFGYQGVFDTNLYRGSANLLKTNGSFFALRGISGSYLTIDHQANISGSLVVKNDADIDGETFSVDAPNNRVGIGTSSPQALLHIFGAGNAHLRLTDADAADTVTADPYISFRTSDETEIGWIGDGSPSGDLLATVANTGEVRLVTVAAQPISFKTTNTTRFTITAAGDVTVSPNSSAKAKLDVLGTISGSRLSVSRNANITGSLLTVGTITSRSTVSGATLKASGNLSFFSGTPWEGTFDHALTAARTWTMPDATTTIVGIDTTDTLTNKTINVDKNTISSLTGALVWYVDGDLATGTEQSVTFTMPYTATVADIELHVKTAPTGQAIIVDVNENGTTVFGTKPQINAAATTEADTQTITDTTLTKGSEITLDIDQIGSGTAGNGLTVQLMLRFDM